MPTLQIICTSSEKKLIELIRDEYTIGRGKDNSIQLADARASRHHGRIFLKQQRFFFEDTGSANGTTIDGKAAKSNSPIQLNNNANIVIGDTTLILTGIKTTEPAPPPLTPEFKAYSDDEALFNTDEHDISTTIDASVNISRLALAENNNSTGITDALQQLQAMCLISEAAGNILQLDQLLEKILITVAGIFPKTGRAFILLKKDSNFIPAALYADGRCQPTEKNLSISSTVLHICTDKKRAILSNNTSQDDRFDSSRSIAELAIKSFICSPLINNDNVLGIIQIEAENTTEFTESDLQTLTGISAQTAIAVQNIYLAEKIEQEATQRSALQRYFSPNMVEMLLNGNLSTELGGKEYTGTVFFSDIIGFTQMSEKMSAQQVVHNLNSYFSIMQSIIYQNAGNVDKFGGDAIMAFWSVPHARDNDEFNAVLTGIQMQTAIYSFNAELHAEGNTPIFMGIGINTGNFVAGNIGSADKIEFTLIGDNVNLAARIESRAGKTQVLCSRNTYLKIKDTACAIELPPVNFKGKSSQHTIYSIRGLKISEDTMQTCIPLLPENNRKSKDNSFSMLTKIFRYSENSHAEIISGTSYNTGESVTFTCCLNEYHKKLEFTGKILTVKKLQPLEQADCYQYTLSIIEDTDFTDTIQAGKHCITKLAWDDMPREQNIGDNR